MWFDVQAALGGIDAEPRPKKAKSEPAPGANRANRAKRANSDHADAPNLAHLARLACPQPSELKNADPAPAADEPSPSRQKYPPGAIVHLARYRPKLGRDGRTVRQLPTHPATCAICGVADWFVCMTDMQGRTLHVCCWKVEGGTT